MAATESLLISAGPRASGRTFAVRVSDGLRLEFTGEPVELPATLEYEQICKTRGAEFGKKAKRKVSTIEVLRKCIDQGYLEWHNKPEPPPRKRR